MHRRPVNLRKRGKRIFTTNSSHSEKRFYRYSCAYELLHYPVVYLDEDVKKLEALAKPGIIRWRGLRFGSSYALILLRSPE